MGGPPMGGPPMGGPPMGGPPMGGPPMGGPPSMGGPMDGPPQGASHHIFFPSKNQETFAALTASLLKISQAIRTLELPWGEMLHQRPRCMCRSPASSYNASGNVGNVQSNIAMDKRVIFPYFS